MKDAGILTLAKSLRGLPWQLTLNRCSPDWPWVLYWRARDLQVFLQSCEFLGLDGEAITKSIHPYEFKGWGDYLEECYRRRAMSVGGLPLFQLDVLPPQCEISVDSLGPFR